MYDLFGGYGGGGGQVKTANDRKAPGKWAALSEGSDALSEVVLGMLEKNLPVEEYCVYIGIIEFQDMMDKSMQQ